MTTHIAWPYRERGPCRGEGVPTAACRCCNDPTFALGDVMEVLQRKGLVVPGTHTGLDQHEINLSSPQSCCNGVGDP